MQRVLELMVRSLYLPVFLLVGNGVAVFWISEGLPKVWLIVWMFVFIGLSFLAENLVPYDVVFNRPGGDRARDICHAIINESLTVVGLWILPVISGSVTVISFWPSDWPLALQLVLAIFIADVGISLAHYASHRMRFLWKLHAVHHSVKRMYPNSHVKCTT